MRLWYLLPLFGFASCAEEPSLSKSVLPPDKIQSVLYDVIRADEMIDFFQINDSTFRATGKRKAIYDTVFQLHQINNKVFDSSVRYYRSRPDLLRDILEKLQKKVSADTAEPKTRINSPAH